MNIFSRLLSAALLGATCMTAHAAVTTYKYEFAESTPLASGKWVKIFTSSSGIYQIPYQKLREMGFSDPSKVAVYGRGGRQHSHNFHSSSNSTAQRLYEDTPQKVPVKHTDEALYFYGAGVENIVPNSSSLKFVHDTPNIYVNEGVYLLSDSSEPLAVSTMIASKESPSEYPNPIDYEFFEEDRIQGLDGTGQYFWSYNFNDVPYRDWELNLPYAVPQKLCNIDIMFVSDADSKGSLKWGIGSTFSSITLQRQNANSYLASNSSVRMPGKGEPITLKVMVEDLDSEVAGLDCWVLTYYKKFDTEMRADFVQERISVNTSDSSTRCGYVTVPSGAEVWDVTDPFNPVIVETEESRAYIDNDGKRHNLVLFDPRKTQRAIADQYREVPNQNLHALAAEGADLLIITTDAMRPWAEKIARLHEKYDEMKTVVVTAEQLYNEYTAGLPDPMAYRAMAKTLYQSEFRQLKNILLFGPVFADMRNVTKRTERLSDGSDGLIAFQEPGVLIHRTAANANDYYAILTDYIPSLVDLASNRMATGIGILPVQFPQDAESVCDKISGYITETDFEWVVNETFASSCPGDNYMHDSQALSIVGILSDHTGAAANSRFLHDVSIIDYTGAERGVQDFKRLTEQGKLLSYYFGHAGLTGLTHTLDYLNTSNFQTLNNRNLGFMFFAGCDLSHPDLGTHGIGELSVTRSPRGLVGSVIATREVLSNFNFNLAKAFTQGLFYSDFGIRNSSPTLGEVLAYAKNQTGRTNDLNYQAIGDPALRIPVAVRGITLEIDGDKPVAPGEVITVKGRVKQRRDVGGNNWEDDKSYNGRIALKLVSPADSVKYYHTVKLVEKVDDAGNKITYNDTTWRYIPASPVRLSSVRADVRDGEFTARISVPADLAKHIRYNQKNPELQIFAGAYDRNRQLGASGYLGVATYGYGETPVVSRPRDTQEPEVECSYDPLTQTILFKVTDDVAVMPGVGPDASLRVWSEQEDFVVNLSKDYSCPVTSFGARIPVFSLPAGKHTIAYRACDEAGNSTAHTSLTFTKSAASPISLKALAESAVESMTFAVGNCPEGSEPELVVLDSSGKLVYSAPVSGSTAVWDCAEARAGRYRAAVRDNSPRGSMAFSNWTDFAVID